MLRNTGFLFSTKLISLTSLSLMLSCQVEGERDIVSAAATPFYDGPVGDGLENLPPVVGQPLGPTHPGDPVGDNPPTIVTSPIDAIGSSVLTDPPSVDLGIPAQDDAVVIAPPVDPSQDSSVVVHPPLDTVVDSPNVGRPPIVQEDYFYDSGWQALLRDPGRGYDCVVTSSQCNSQCNGKSVGPRDYVNHGTFHQFIGCDARTIEASNQKNPWTLLFQRGHNSQITQFNNSTGSAVLSKGAAIAISFQIEKSWDYYITVDGRYSGKSDSTEHLQVIVNNTSMVVVKDQDDVSSTEVYRFCYHPQKIALKRGHNTLRFKATGGSVHMDAYRISTHPPKGVPACRP